MAKKSEVLKQLLAFLIFAAVFLWLVAKLQAQPKVATSVEMFDQHRMVGSLNEIVVKICNTGTEKLDVQSIQVWSAVKEQGFDPALRVKIEEEAGSLKGMSGRRKALLVVAGIGAGYSIADQSGLIKIASDQNSQGWRVLAPVAAVAIPMGMVFIQQNVPDTGQPQRDLMLPSKGFSLFAGECATYVIYGTERKP